MAWSSVGEGSQRLWHTEGCYTSVQCFKQQTAARATALRLHAVDLAETSVLEKKSWPEEAGQSLCQLPLCIEL